MKMWEVSIFAFIVAILGFVAIMLKQLQLAFKPDFRLESVPVAALNRAIPYPVAVRFQPSTSSESRSFELDSRLDWRLRILLCGVTFAILQFAPIPAFVAAKQYADLLHAFGDTYQHWDEVPLRVAHVLGAMQSAVWLTSRCSQVGLFVTDGLLKLTFRQRYISTIETKVLQARTA